MNRIVASRAIAILYSFLVKKKVFFENRKILIPANVCPIVPASLYKCQINFEFIDISPDTLAISKSKVLERINDGDIGGLLFVRPYGYMANESDFFQNVKSLKPEVLIIDDRCLTIPDLNSHFSTTVDLILYSTGYSKYVDLNFGGYGYFKDEFSFELVSLPFEERDHNLLTNEFRKFGSGDYNLDIINSDWLQSSAIDTENQYFNTIIERIEEVKIHKDKLNRIYYNELPREISLPHGYHNWRYNILVPRKDYIMKKIFEAELFASSHYSSMADIFSGDEAPVAEDVHSKIINLFNDFRFSEDNAKNICKIINKCLKQI